MFKLIRVLVSSLCESTLHFLMHVFILVYVPSKERLKSLFWHGTPFRFRAQNLSITNNSPEELTPLSSQDRVFLFHYLSRATFKLIRSCKLPPHNFALFPSIERLVLSLLYLYHCLAQRYNLFRVFPAYFSLSTLDLGIDLAQCLAGNVF